MSVETITQTQGHGQGRPMENKQSISAGTCRCGYTLGHHMVSPDPEYTILGWIKLVVGITSRPTKIKYRCRRCDEVIASTTAAEDLDNFY
jgi:hypothetical protein